VSATPNNASGYCRPLDRMTVEHVSQGWPKPQGRSHDAPEPITLVDVLAFIAAVIFTACMVIR
jgi:hypothetical protein